jgi:hypothetical protein
MEVRRAVFGLALPLLLFAAAVGAHAVETGSGVICDTREQARRAPQQASPAVYFTLFKIEERPA